MVPLLKLWLDHIPTNETIFKKKYQQEINNSEGFSVKLRCEWDMGHWSFPFVHIGFDDKMLVDWLDAPNNLSRYSFDEFS